MGSGCGSVGRAVASDTRDPRFESDHNQILLSVNWIEKMKIKKKEPRMAQLKMVQMLLVKNDNILCQFVKHFSFV